MDKLSSAIKKVQQKKKLSEVSPAMIAVAKGAQTLATVAMKAARGEKAGPEARRMAMTHQMATKTVNASYNYDIDEVAFIPALAKGALMIGKAAVKGAAAAAKAGAKGAKVAAKGAKTVAKTGTQVAKSTAKTTSKVNKPASKPVRFKRPNIRSYKNKETGQVDMDRYRADQAKYRKIQQDKKNRPDMSDMKPDGPGDADRTKRGERKLKAIDKLTDKKKENIEKGLQTTGDVAKKTGEVAKSAGRKVKRGISTTTKAFGSSSFAKEGITFKDYLNKL